MDTTAFAEVSPGAVRQPGASRVHFGATFLRPLGWAALIALAVVPRLPFLSVPLTVDEGAYGLWAWLWTGDYQIYRDFIFARPQALIVVYELILGLTDGSVEAIRLFAAGYNVLTVLLVFALAKRLFDERAAWASASLYALFSTAPRVEGFTANAEIFTFAPLVLNALLVWERRWLWAGIATSIAFQIKMSGIEGCVLVAGCALIEELGWRAKLRASATALAGFLAACLPMLAHAMIVGWSHFYYNLVTLRGLSYNAEFASWSGQRSLFTAAVDWTVSSWLLPAALAACAFPVLDARRRRFFAIWLVAAAVAMQIGLYWSWHFFLQLVPPLSVAGGAGLVALRSGSFKWARGVLVAAALALFVSREGRLFFLPPKKICWEIYHRPSYLTAHEAARYVAETTRPDELLYVAFGEPEIYYLAKRRPAVPTQLFNGHARWLDGSWNDALEAVRTGRPDLVVWAQPPPRHRMSTQKFAELLWPRYQPEKKIGVIQILRKRSAPLVGESEPATAGDRSAGPAAPPR